MGLAVVRDLREMRAPAGPEEIERFETDVVAGFVLARAAAGLSDSTIRTDVSHLDQVRTWFGRPLWDMQPGDADAYFGTVLREVPPGTRLARAQPVKTYFEFVELRHKVEIHNLTGRVVECPIDEMNRPRGRRAARLRVPPTVEQAREEPADREGHEERAAHQADLGRREAQLVGEGLRDDPEDGLVPPVDHVQQHQQPGQAPRLGPGLLSGFRRGRGADRRRA